MLTIIPKDEINVRNEICKTFKKFRLNDLLSLAQPFSADIHRELKKKQKKTFYCIKDNNF